MCFVGKERSNYDKNLLKTPNLLSVPPRVEQIVPGLQGARDLITSNAARCRGPHRVKQQYLSRDTC